MITLLQALTFLWLLASAALALRHFAAGGQGSLSMLIITHFFFCGLPIAFDYIFGAPRYVWQPGFAVAATDPPTVLAYCLYASLCPVIWLLHGRRPKHAQEPVWWSCTSGLLLRVRVASLGLSLLPFLLVLLTPDRELYLHYAITVRGLIGEDASIWHPVIGAAAVVAVLATAIYISTLKTVQLHHYLLPIAVVPFCCWISGKRTIVAVSLVVLGYVLWSRQVLRGRRLYLALALGLLLLVAFSFYYQSNVRYANNPLLFSGAETRYESFRIDFFRDDRIKMALYAELHPDEMQILEYRGQSVLFNLVFMLPRSLWPDKPWPYAVYFTSTMLQMYPARWLGWGMTTSWLEEAIANFGWLGVLVGPLSLSTLCRMGEAFRWPALSLLTCMVVVLLMAVQLSAFLGVFLLWVILMTLLRLERPVRSVATAVP